MQRKLLAAAATATVLLAAPALAADIVVPPRGSPLYTPTPMVTAHVEMGIGALGTGGSGFFGSSSTSAGVVGSGRGNKVLWNGWNMELEAGGAALFNGGSAVAVLGLYGHAWRMATPATWVGIFGGAAAAGAAVGTIGVEAKHGAGPVNIGGMLAESFTSGGQSTMGAVDVNDYLDPNTRIGAKALFVGGTSGTSSTYLLTADFEHRFVDPISIWGSVDYAAASGNSATAWAGLIGLRIFADGVNGTLKGQDDIVPWHFTDPFRAY